MAETAWASSAPIMFKRLDAGHMWRQDDRLLNYASLHNAATIVFVLTQPEWMYDCLAVPLHSHCALVRQENRHCQNHS